jgi:MYND finger
MASKDEIDAECLRLRVKLAQNEQECSNAGEDMLSAEMSPLLQQRRAMQHQLEILVHQCTKLEELEMVVRTQRRAVTSGLVIRATPHQNVKECRAWLNGTEGVPQDKAWELALPAARNGNAAAQHICGMIAAERDEALDSLRWYILSAAQGYRGSEYEVGRLYYEEGTLVVSEKLGLEKHFCLVHEGTICTPDCLSQAHYWLKRAALQDFIPAQLHLTRVLMELKADLSDGNPNILGYSAHPESFYWSHRAASNIRAKGMTVPADIPNYRCHDHACANCKVAPSASVVIQICGHCKAVGYCSKNCQKKHWRLGHKVDCRPVEELILSMPKVD